ncbi:HlyD family secretion protein [soil metagenome]
MSHDSYSSATLARPSPLCTEAYRRPSADLPPVVPPSWMRRGMIVAIVLTLGIGAVTLLNPMDEYVTAPGEIRPADYAYIYSRSDGILESVDILNGQRVKKGQVLARLDGWDIRKQISQIDGDIAQAKAEQAMAEASRRKVEAAPVPPEFLFSGVEVERQKEIQSLQQDYLRRLNELQKTGAASVSETLNLRLQLIASESILKRNEKAYELFKGDYGAATQAEATERGNMIAARLAALEARRDQALGDLKRLEIVASEDGVILATASRFPGEKITAGTALFKVADDDRKELRLYAGEDRINMIQPGQKVRFRAHNNPDRLAALALGKVEEVARDHAILGSSANNENAPQGSYRVSVAIENEPYPLAVGANVDAEIVIGSRPFWQLLFLKASKGS